MHSALDVNIGERK